jgi:hypothetical protein
MRVITINPTIEDRDHLLTSIEELRGKCSPPHLLLALGHTLLERTRFGSADVYRLDDKTHLISVFGSIDAAADDWFASDFCLLYTALGGIAKHVKYLTNIDLKKFINENGPLLPDQLEVIRSPFKYST